MDTKILREHNNEEGGSLSLDESTIIKGLQTNTSFENSISSATFQQTAQSYKNPALNIKAVFNDSMNRNSQHHHT